MSEHTDHAPSLRDAREWNGLTLDEVAAEASVDPTWLSRAERGYRPISLGQQQAIRDAIARIVARRHGQCQ